MVKRTPKQKDLLIQEWDLWKCATSKIDACFLYEYARSTKSIVAALKGRQDFNKSGLIHYPFVAFATDAERVPVFHLYVTRDFPRIPFRLLPADVQQKLVRKIPSAIAAARPLPDNKFVSLDEAEPLICRVDSDDRVSFFVKPWTAKELVHLAIDWNEGNPKIVRDFKRLLPSIRPIEGQRDGSVKRTEKMLRALGGVSTLE